ncbi:hypothetical protein B0I35DRAFT_405182 [Stachybotrys elegans]|uniref:Exonuclease domain-containing protein n=1 Tax=Stachybotrys elegans TaxID=80388 RepID=A0A8K0T4B5_9HYPO|nr:hypothetical protein B0I35DRAFT_405182 [Stachybotrys elegans]
MSLNLKHIPCPAGKTCTAFQCIFGHPDTDAPAAHATITETANPSSSEPASRKRVKLEDGSKLDISAHASEPPKKSSISTHQLDTATRPISPPPPRKLPAASAATTASASASKSAKAPTIRPPAASKPSPAATPKKAETLNPRLLKSSPASHEIRLRLVRMLNEQFTRLNSELKKDANDDEKKLVLNDQELIVRTLDQEQNLAVTKAAVYANVMKNLVMQYKRMSVAQWKTERLKEVQISQKKPGDSAALDIPKKIETGLTPAQEVQLLQRLLTPVDKLGAHGYVSAVPSDEAIDKARKGVEMAKGFEKCDRCQQRFQVFPGRREEDGALASGGSCNFHWGKSYFTAKAPGDRTKQPKRYLCCGEEVGDSPGCFTRDHHVYKTSDPKRLASVLNYAETPQNPLAPKDRAVCFDCEMGYTVHGMELIRLTATAWPTGEELLDVLVRPVGEILDLNSRYSGVWPEDLAQAESWTAEAPTKAPDDAGSEDGEVKATKKKLKIVSSPEVARDLLFSLISPATPLIGHGLENDLNAVRIVHPALIDTVLLYPHKAGLPYRYSLKMLMSNHLNRKIQQETGPKMLGHDSAEDARAAGDLVRLRVMDEWKRMRLDGWKVEDGNIVPPTGTSTAGKLTEEFLEA